MESGRRRNDGKDWEAGKEVEIRMFRVGKRERKEGMGRRLELEGKRKEGKEQGGKLGMLTIRIRWLELGS